MMYGMIFLYVILCISKGKVLGTENSVFSSLNVRGLVDDRGTQKNWWGRGNDILGFDIVILYDWGFQNSKH